MRGELTLREEDRGQSGVLGVALITALVVVGTVGIVALGTGVLADGRNDAQIQSAEQAMTKFDATAALVALGRSDTKRAAISLNGFDEQLTVNPDEGWMQITIKNETDGSTWKEFTKFELGSVVYEKGNTKIGYQGGGVWKKIGNGSVMISPPEFHYRGNTLTLPLISVQGNAGSLYSGDLVLKSDRTREQIYPNRSTNPPLLNPLDSDMEVYITVKSDFYQAWGSFFNQRTEGAVSYDHANETATILLTVPDPVFFSEPLVTTNVQDYPSSCNSATINCEEIIDRNLNLPDADLEIEGMIDECEDGACETRLANETDNLDGNETYYYPNGITDGDFTVDTSAGNVTLVIDGPVSLGDVVVNGDNRVKIYLRADLEVTGDSEVNMDPDNSATQFITYVHSTANLTMGKGGEIRGLLYAPKSKLTINGDFTLHGSFVVEEFVGNGMPSGDYDDSFKDVELNVGTGLDYINYLYISRIDMNVTDT